MSKRYADHLFESLPAIYRTEGRSGFTYRFLSLFAEALEEAEDLVYGYDILMNPNKSQLDFLPWLASWVALDLDENWPVEKQRELIRSTIELYRWRGTIKGIETFVEIYTGFKPVIIEPFNAGWRVGVDAVLGVNTRIYEPASDVHCFCVIVTSNDELTEQQKQKVMAIVEIQKPAHTKVISYGWYAEFWWLGVKSTVGVDMRVGS